MSKNTPKTHQKALNLNHANAGQALRKPARSDAMDEDRNEQDPDGSDPNDQGPDGITKLTPRKARINELGNYEDASSDNQSEFRHDANRSDSLFSAWHKENPDGNYEEWRRQKNAENANSGERDAGAAER